VGMMSECENLAGIVLSLNELVAATSAKPTLNQLLGMALIEASECLVRAGFAPEMLGQLGLDEEVSYFLDAKYGPADARPRTGACRSRGRPYLRLVGA
jgi:hypothetical protein